MKKFASVFALLAVLALGLSVVPVRAGTISILSSAPTGNVVLDSTTGTYGSKKIACDYSSATKTAGDPMDPNDGTDGRWRKGGQSIGSSELDGDETNIIALTLKVLNGTTVAGSGTNELVVWIGKWNSAGNATGDTIIQETFDVTGMTIPDGDYLKFTFSTAFSLPSEQDYAFQFWWTSEGDSHYLYFDRHDDISDGTDYFSGNMQQAETYDPDNGGQGITTFPFSSPSNYGNRDVLFIMQQIPEPSTLVLGAIGLLGLALCAWRRRK